jgi:hypothetical protein
LIAAAALTRRRRNRTLKAGVFPVSLSKCRNVSGKKRNPVPSLPVLANTGAMNQFIGAFEVTSKLSGHVYDCRFSHIWNAIATRHSDTIDAKFEVDDVGRIVGLAHPAFVEFREKSGRDLTDREGSFIAAEFLRERLEEEDERPLYDVPHEEVQRLIKMIGIK